MFAVSYSRRCLQRWMLAPSHPTNEAEGTDHKTTTAWAHQMGKSVSRLAGRECYSISSLPLPEMVKIEYN